MPDGHPPPWPRNECYEATPNVRRPRPIEPASQRRDAGASTRRSGREGRAPTSRSGARIRCHSSIVSKDFYCERVLSGVEAVDLVHEDELVVAFHHTRPFFADAHIVVVPRQHVASLVDPASDAVLPHLLAVVREVAARVLDLHGAARVLTNLGRYQDSKHLHFHVYAGDETGGGAARPSTGSERSVGART